MKVLTTSQKRAMQMISQSKDEAFTATIFSGSNVVGHINSNTIRALCQRGLIEALPRPVPDDGTPEWIVRYGPPKLKLTERGKAYLAGQNKNPIKQADWVICPNFPEIVGTVQRVACDGSWADVKWPAGNKRMPTASLQVQTTIQVGDWTITDIPREQELKRL